VSIGAASDTTAAEDTLGCITDKSGSKCIDVCLRVNTLESIFSCACDLSYAKELALAILIALLTVLIVIGKHKLYRSSTSLYCCRRRDLDLHTLSYRIYAGCNESSGACSLYETYTA
jgi:hypothetical protein